MAFYLPARSALHDTLMAEQRHTYLDLDPDSRFRPTDRALCQHGRPVGQAFAVCDECRWAQYRHHTEDWEEVCDGAIRLCRRCGLSSGTHTGGLL